jgi:phage shock protein A
MPDQPETPDTGTDEGYDSAGVPTFDSVREKIENRYAAAHGAAELDAESPEGRSVEEQYEQHRRDAAARLEQIRREAHGGPRPES